MASSPHSSRPDSGASSAPRPYHHGDLRQALLDAAVALLREGGAEALTLRAVARAAGVSQTAPYRHFKDRRALVAGVAQEAFARMGAAIGIAVQRGEPGLPALRRGMAAYIRFAQEHPAEYRVMFGPELARRDDLPQLHAAALGVFGLLRDGIARLQQGGAIGEGDPGLMAITAWATLHGLAMLSLDGQTAVTDHSAGTLVDVATGLLLAGMGAVRPGPLTASPNPTRRRRNP
jgi:AcrR family transcriptional regulator